MDHLEKRLDRIEEKLDEVLNQHSNRITQLETQSGFFKLAFGSLFSAAAWLFHKLHLS
jgi:Holliday junction resolvasome RuvABC endonuclease subunit